jgi:tellurite resistance protein TehA-like permease
MTSLRIAALMVVEAASLAVMSILHLTGHLDGSSPFNPTRAGIAEALIGVVLLLGALALVRSRRHALSIAIAANAFAVVGFVIGLTRTTEGGGAVDIAYHVTLLPLLVLTLVVLVIRGMGRARHRFA